MKMSDEQPELVEYGIRNELSDIRAHLCFKTKTLYAFPTKSGLEDMERCISERKTTYKYGYQRGINYATGGGYPIPWNEIKNLKRVRMDDDWFKNYAGPEKMTTSEIGDMAVEIVMRLMREGRFPFFVDPSFCLDADLQRRGMDIHVNGKWKIEVKGETYGGEKERGGSGNLFFQTHELNPLKRY